MDTVVEAPPARRIIPNAVKFTKENAAEMARRGHEKRRLAKAAAESPDVVIPTYVMEQLKVVRARMTQVNELMSQATDARDLDRLASAWSKLAEQERILDGRPLPGSLRPSSKVKSASRSIPEPE